MRRLPALIAAATFAVPATVVLSTAQAGAQVKVSPVVVTGTAHCNVDTGHETYTLTWTVTNNTGEFLTIVDDSVESGAFDGTVNFTPNPVAIDGAATGTDGPVPNTSGVVSITVDWSIVGGEFPVDGTSGAEITLDGSCRLPATTTIAPTTTAQEAIVVRPTFTG